MIERVSDLQNSVAFAELANGFVSAGTGLRFEARGQSMAPAIQDGDVLRVEPNQRGKIRLGDIVFFERKGQFKAHRVVRRQPGQLITRGDTSMQTDGAILKEDILGVVTVKECRGTGRMVRLNGIGPRIQFFAREMRRSLALRSRLSWLGFSFLVVALVLGAQSSSAQLLIDHANTVSQPSLTGPDGTFTLANVPLTITAGANLLVVGVSFNSTGNTGSHVSGITWAGTSFSAANSFVYDPGNGLRVEIWFLTSPTSGANNVSVSVIKAAGNGNRLGVQVGAIDFSGADTSSPIRGAATANGSGTATSVTIASATPEIVLDTLVTPGGPTVSAVGSGQTQRWSATSTGGNANQNAFGFGSTQPGASSITMSETLSASSIWADEAVSIRPPEADVAITKTSPATVTTNTNFNYTLKVTNNGPRSATNVVVTDSLPSGVTWQSQTTTQGTCTQNAGLVTCSLGTMGNGTTQTVTITVKAGVPAQVTNTGTVSSSLVDPVLSNNSSSVTTTILYTTAVHMTKFSAARSGGGVLLSWKSGGEVRNLGYNVYREDGGQKTRLNSALIAGSALLMRDAIAQHAAKTYAWVDHTPKLGAQYWLEDVDLNGTRSIRGPISVSGNIPALAAAVASDQSQSIASRASGSGFVRSSPAAAAQMPPDTDIAHVRQTVAHPQASARLAVTGFALASMPAVKIFVDHEGWYRLTQPQLVAAGLNANVDASSLHIYAEGVEQPIRVTPDDGSFGPRSAIEFYGTAIDTPYSGERVYWLVSNGKPGLRIPQITPGSAGPQAQTFTQTLELKPRSTYFAALLREDTDNFFGPLISSTPDVEKFNISNLAPGEGKLELLLQGVTENQSHDVTVVVNGATLGDVVFTGQEQGHAEFPVPSGVFATGANTITLTAQQGDTDLSLIDTIDISFPHTFTAESDFLQFNADAGQAVSIVGFVQAPSHLIDVTDPAQPFELEHAVSLRNGTYSLQANIPWTSSGEHTLLALSDAAVSIPNSLAYHAPTTLHVQQPGAQLVILTAPQFLHQLVPLATLHRSQGQSVALLPVDAIYDEFNFGERTPYAVKSFLKTATQSWTNKPHYLVLAGDASLDPRNYLGLGYFDFVPTKILPTAELKTASDDWFSDFDNTGLAQIATGRLPARTEADAKLMVAKIVNYANTAPAAWTSQALLAADRDDPTLSFTQASQTVQKQLPSAITATDVFATALGIPAAKQNLLLGLNAGQLFVNYNGHGSVQVWSGSDLFDDAAASSLANGEKLPFFAIMNCLNGYFQDVYTQSLAESLLLAPNGGAVAVWASSGLTQPGPQFSMNQRLVEVLFSQPMPAIGDAVLAAKSSITDQDVRKTFILFGDPAMRLQTTITTKQK